MQDNDLRVRTRGWVAPPGHTRVTRDVKKGRFEAQRATPVDPPCALSRRR